MHDPAAKSTSEISVDLMQVLNRLVKILLKGITGVKISDLQPARANGENSLREALQRRTWGFTRVNKKLDVSQ